MILSFCIKIQIILTETLDQLYLWDWPIKSIEPWTIDWNKIFHTRTVMNIIDYSRLRINISETSVE